MTFIYFQNNKTSVMASTLYRTHKVPFNDGNDVTDQLLLTESLINKLQNLYGIAPSTFA